MITERRKILVRECVSEAFRQAREEVDKLLLAHGLERHAVGRELNCSLYVASGKACKWAMTALEVDTRVHKHVHDICK